MAHVYFTCGGISSFWNHLVGLWLVANMIPFMFPEESFLRASTDWLVESKPNQPKSARTDRCVLLKNRRALAHLFKELVF